MILFVAGALLMISVDALLPMDSSSRQGADILEISMRKLGGRKEVLG